MLTKLWTLVHLVFFVKYFLPSTSIGRAGFDSFLPMTVLSSRLKKRVILFSIQMKTGSPPPLMPSSNCSGGLFEKVLFRCHPPRVGENGGGIHQPSLLRGKGLEFRANRKVISKDIAEPLNQKGNWRVPPGWVKQNRWHEISTVQVSPHERLFLSLRYPGQANLDEVDWEMWLGCLDSTMSNGSSCWQLVRPTMKKTNRGSTSWATSVQTAV